MLGRTDYLITIMSLHVKTTEILNMKPGECEAKKLKFVAKIVLKSDHLKHALLLAIVEEIYIFLSENLRTKKKKTGYMKLNNSFTYLMLHYTEIYSKMMINTG